MYFLLQVSTLHTEEIEFGLLLTPTAVQTCEDPKDMRARVEKNGYKNGTQFGSLTSQVVYGNLLPTPVVMDTNGGNVKKIDERRERALSKGINGNGFGKTLSEIVQREIGETSQLNPRFVAEMMGFPPDWTELPFQNGEEKASKPMETQ